MKMNKRIFILFMISFVVFIIAILGINILIKSYEKESMVSAPGAQADKQTAVMQTQPIEEKTTLEPQEEPEREAPIQTGEPLVN